MRHPFHGHPHHANLHAASGTDDMGFRGGRHGSGRGGHRGPGGFGGRGGHGERVFHHGALRLVVLALIAEEPRHGYEITKSSRPSRRDWRAATPPALASSIPPSHCCRSSAM
jgi:hypothetical protein